jgi:2-polyprenyl-6-methoxyphenol hydroxylase-like FAD-dependent oxidoreductase
MFLVENTDDPGRRSRDSLPERMREMLADFGGAAGEARERITDADQIVQRPIESILLPTPWHRGRVLLIGDAAHAAPPHLASGAAMAIEDAVVLSEMLANGGELDETLTAFAERRFERCRVVVENSLQLGEWERRAGDPAADPAGLMNASYAALAQAY